MKYLILRICLFTLYVFLNISFGLAQELGLKEPIHFRDYKELFAYIASQNELDGDDNTLFVLAADSQIDYQPWPGNLDEAVAIITANYYEKMGLRKINRIRGASYNGRFYVVRPDGEGYALVGILEGNGYHWASINGKEALITSWHMSASESIETVYRWDGRIFRQVAREDKKYN